MARSRRGKKRAKDSRSARASEPRQGTGQPAGPEATPAVNNDEDLRGKEGRETGAAGTSPEQGAGGRRQRNGGQFQPGTNSHTGQIFQRGPDRIPTRSMNLMLRVVQSDKREDLYRGLCAIAEMARTKPRAFLKLVEIIADRTEGRPTQHVVNERRRTTLFIRDPGEAIPAPSPEEVVAAVLEGVTHGGERVDLAIPLPAQGLTVLPPPAP